MRQFTRLMVFISVSWLSPAFLAGIGVFFLVLVVGMSWSDTLLWIIVGVMTALDVAWTAYSIPRLVRDETAWQFADRLSRRASAGGLR